MISFLQNLKTQNIVLILVLIMLPLNFLVAQYSGKALEFYDATPSEYAEGSGISTSVSNLTLEAWVYLHTLTSEYQRIITIGGEVACLRVSNTYDIEFFIKTDGTIRNLVQTRVISDNWWHHVAGTWDGTTMKLYLDGTEVTSITPGGSLDTPDGTVMLAHDISNEGLDGYIDEVRMWDIARTGEQIKNNMFTELTGSETGLIHYWKLNGAGTDEVGTADLTLHEGPSWQRSGAIYGPKYALDFDGIDDYVNCGNDNSLDLTSSISLEAWVKPISGSDIKTIVSKKASGSENPGYAFYINSFGTSDQKLVFETQNAILKTDNAVINWGAWQHVVISTDGTTNKMYVNGKEESCSGSVNLSSSTQNFTIGSFPDGSSYNFNGIIDEVRIWNDVRTEDEIRNNYCNVLRGNEDGLAGYWRFDQTADSHAPDQTGINHGTLNNMSDDDWVSVDQFNTYTGQNSGNSWHNNISWSLNRIPNSADNVCIPNLMDVYIMSGNASCNDIVVHSGRDLYLHNGNMLSVAGNLWAVGNLSTTGGILYVKLSGGSKTHSVYASSSLKYLELDDANGAELLGNLTIDNDLKITNGDLDLNGNVLTLGGSATFSETAGNTVTGSSGYIQTTRNLNAPSSENVAGLGAIISSSADLGSTTIKRGHTAQNGSGNTGIERYYDIDPQNNTGLDATLVFCYDDSEVSGFTEDNLCLFRSTDDGSTWSQEGGTCNSSTNQIELSGIDAFSLWTAADIDSPLPVELTAFSAELLDDKVLLVWKTASEVDNYGFEIERTIQNIPSREGMPEGQGWVKIGFIEGAGNSNSPKDYEFIDEDPPAGKLQYRLKQIDTDGSFQYSHIIEVALNDELPSKFKLYQNFPNPFNPVTTIKFSIPSTITTGTEKSVQTLLKVYDVTGREIATLINQELEPGQHTITFNAENLSSGVYFYRLSAGNFIDIKKMSIIK